MSSRKLQKDGKKSANELFHILYISLLFAFTATLAVSIDDSNKWWRTKSDPVVIFLSTFLYSACVFVFAKALECIDERFNKS